MPPPVLRTAMPFGLPLHLPAATMRFPVAPAVGGVYCQPRTQYPSSCGIHTIVPVQPGFAVPSAGLSPA